MFKAPAHQYIAQSIEAKKQMDRLQIRIVKAAEMSGASVTGFLDEIQITGTKEQIAEFHRLLKNA